MTHTIEVIKKATGWKVYTAVYGSPRDTFQYKTEKAAVRKVQELERNGYTLVTLSK